MKPVTLPGVEEYAERSTTPDPEPLRALARETWRDFSAPQMMMGPVGGRFLQMLVYAMAPMSVLEVGTFTGYSALSMAAVLPEGARLVTCEADPRHASRARRNIAASPYADRIAIEVGPALETLRRLEGPFDLVFLDADKREYEAYLEAVLPKLSSRGIVAADNTLWNGAVLNGDGDAETEALRRFNARLPADPRLECVLLTVRDGITLIRRR